MRRLRQQVLAAGDVVTALDEVPRDQIAGDYLADRRARADGAPVGSEYEPPEVHPPDVEQAEAARRTGADDEGGTVPTASLPAMCGRLTNRGAVPLLLLLLMPFGVAANDVLVEGEAPVTAAEASFAPQLSQDEQIVAPSRATGTRAEPQAGARTPWSSFVAVLAGLIAVAVPGGVRCWADRGWPALAAALADHSGSRAPPALRTA